MKVRVSFRVKVRVKVSFRMRLRVCFRVRGLGLELRSDVVMFCFACADGDYCVLID